MTISCMRCSFVEQTARSLMLIGMVSNCTEEFELASLALTNAAEAGESVFLCSVNLGKAESRL